jgi:Domain of Unknown Function (DUF1080).
LNSDFYCYHTGKVENGLFYWKRSDQCNQAFRSQTWIKLRIKVNGSKARLYGNNGFIVEWDIDSKDSGKGGLIVTNGFSAADQTKVYFKDLNIK